jgi:biopolymer transport protein ExbD
MSFSSQNKVKAEGGMSSMTDLVFLLLIFFIILSTMSAKPTLNVDLPSNSNKAPTSKRSDVFEVAVSADNLYFIDNKKSKFYTLEEIIPILDSKMSEQTDKKIKISGDKAADYEFVFKLIALSKDREWKPVLIYKD